MILDQKKSVELLDKKSNRKVLAVASTGGHWEQLMRLVPSFQDGDITFVSTDIGQKERYGIDSFVEIKDYSADEKLKVLYGFVETFFVVLKSKPDVVVSTGAAPGLLCLLWGRFFGARTIWIDSIANSQKLSLSGRLAMKFCHVVLTQWEHLARGNRPRYRGSIL